jgi:hypothetical protein
VIEIDIYSVGVLDAILHDARALAAGMPAGVKLRLPFQLRLLVRQLLHGHWRQARMHLNGYMAEPKQWPEGLERCGTGWTRSRALDSLGREMAKAGHIMVRANYS